MNIGTLTIEMAANVARLAQDMDRAQRIADARSKRMAEAFSMAGKAFAAIGGAISVAAVSAAIKQVADTADSLAKLSQKTGITVESLQKLQYHAELSGASNETLNQGVTRLAKNMADAARGTGTAKDAFAALGVKVTTSTGALKGSDQMLMEIADALSRYRDGTGKAAIAQELFGKSGAELIPLLNGGAGAIRASGDELQRMGGIISADVAKQSEIFNDNLTRLEKNAGALSVQIAGPLITALADVTTKFIEAKNAGEGFFAALGAALFKPEKINELVAAAERIRTINAEINAPQTGMRAAPEYRAALQRSLADALKQYDALAAKLPVVATAAAEAEKPVLSFGGSTESAAEAAKKLADAGIDLANSLLAQDGGLSGDFADKWNQLNAAWASGAIDVDKLAAAQALLLEQQPAIKKAAEEAAQLQEDYAANVAAALGPLEEQARAMERQVATYGKTEGQIQRTIVARLEEAKAIASANGALPEHIKYLEREIEARKRIAAAADNLDGRKVAEDAARAASDEWQRTAESIEQSLTDALMRGFESGKDFGKNLRDTLINMFRTLVLRPLIQPVMMSAAGGITGMLSGGAQAGQDGSGNLLTSALGQGGSIFGAGGLTGALMSGAGWMTGATTMSGALGAAGSLIGTGTVGGVASGAAMGAGALGAAALPTYLFGQKYGVVGGLAGGLGTTAAIGGLSAMGAGGAGFMAGAGGALAAMGPIGWAALAIGAILGASSKPNTPDNYWQETTRDLTTGQILSQTNNPDSRRHSPQNLATSDALSQYAVALNHSLFALSGRAAAESVKFGVGNKDKQLWIDGEAIHEGDRFRRMSVDELREVFDREMIARVFEDLREDVRAIVAEIEADGRAMGDALANVVQLDPLNQWLERLNVAVLDISLAGADAVAHLAELTGGLENLAGLQRSYYDAFFSNEEKLLHMREDLSAALSELGLGMVHTSAGFRALVEAQDPMTESGRETYATLLALSPQMRGYLDLLAEQTGRTDAATEAATRYRAAMTEQTRAAQESVSRLQRLSDLLRGTLDRMSLGTAEEEQRRRDLAQAQITTALALARASGGRTLPDADAIAPALARVTEPSGHLFATFEDYAADYARTANTIAGLLEITDDQLSIEEQTLRWMKERSEIEDGQHAASLAGLGAIETLGAETVQGLDTINSTLRAAFSDEIDTRERRREIETSNRFGSGGGDLLTIDDLSGEWAELMGLTRAQAEEIIAARAALGRDTPTPVWAGLPIQPGGALSERGYLAQNPDVAAAVAAGQFGSAYEHWLLHGQFENRIPGFATGGQHAGGWRVVGERGPELEYTPPSRIYTGSQAQSLVDIGPIVAELRALHAQVARLERAQVATATHSQRAARALDEIAERQETLA